MLRSLTVAVGLAASRMDADTLLISNLFVLDSSLLMGNHPTRAERQGEKANNNIQEHIGTKKHQPSQIVNIFPLLFDSSARYTAQSFSGNNDDVRRQRLCIRNTLK
jgi:hypothetical protein